jgi:hypothetical protein
VRQACVLDRATVAFRSGLASRDVLVGEHDEQFLSAVSVDTVVGAGVLLQDCGDVAKRARSSAWWPSASLTSIGS